jgi:hypothetical protein
MISSAGASAAHRRLSDRQLQDQDAVINKTKSSPTPPPSSEHLPQHHRSRLRGPETCFPNVSTRPSYRSHQAPPDDGNVSRLPTPTPARVTDTLYRRCLPFPGTVAVLVRSSPRSKQPLAQRTTIQPHLLPSRLEELSATAPTDA